MKYRLRVALALIDQHHCPCPGCKGQLALREDEPSWRRCTGCRCSWRASLVHGRRYAETVPRHPCLAKDQGRVGGREEREVIEYSYYEPGYDKPQAGWKPRLRMRVHIVDPDRSLEALCGNTLPTEKPGWARRGDFVTYRKLEQEPASERLCGSCVRVRNGREQALEAAPAAERTR